MSEELDKFTKLRMERAGKKYIMPDGTNQAWYRNSALDILEEISDIRNIMGLWQSKIAAYPEKSFSTYMSSEQLKTGQLMVENLWNLVMFVYKIAPDVTVVDADPNVKRVATITNEGKIE
jgi:hypothetical protein